MNANCRGVPLRWTAKEALNEGKYSQASDIFAFGVCLWEIYTYAREFDLLYGIDFLYLFNKWVYL